MYGCAYYRVAVLVGHITSINPSLSLTCWAINSKTKSQNWNEHSPFHEKLV